MAGVVLDWLTAVKERAPTITMGQIILLLQVSRNEGVRINELVALCDEPPCNISRFVRRMTSPDYPGSLGDAYGLLDLLRGGRDGRARHVVLSDEGRRLVELLSTAFESAPARADELSDQRLACHGH